MVDLFAAIGFGQWFRYLTGAIEISAAVALLIPSAAPFGAILLLPTMIGAVVANLFLGQSPAVPLAVLTEAPCVGRDDEARAVSRRPRQNRAIAGRGDVTTRCRDRVRAPGSGPGLEGHGPEPVAQWAGAARRRSHGKIVLRVA